MTDPLDGYEFALCLTHDVDRVYKTFQAPYYAVVERDPSHLRSLVTGERPYWQFESLAGLEDDLGVRSSVYVLDERSLFRATSPRGWVDPRNWMLYAGRYDPAEPEIADALRRLAAGGWEIGLHGSYDSADDRGRLREEKRQLEDVVGSPVRGGRQHYLNLEPRTWEHHRAIGLRYDASYGSSTRYGFDGRYEPFRPFDDAFVVFPLTLMERAVVESTTSIDAAWRECRRLLEEAHEHDAVMTVLWHPRYLNESEFPGYRTLYERLIREARAMDAWIGPCGEYYERLERQREATSRR